MSHIKISKLAILVSAIIVASGTIFFTTVSAQAEFIPTWVRSIASWWSEGKISDAEYLNATQFLVQNGIIKIPMIIDLQNKVQSLQSQVDDDKKEIVILENQLAVVQSSNSSTSSSSQTTINSASTDLTTEKGIAGAWANNLISDSQFLSAYQKLVDEGVVSSISGITVPYNPDQTIPAWIKNDARWWIQGVISDSSYREAIMYLLEDGYLKNLNPENQSSTVPTNTNSTGTVDLNSEKELAEAWSMNQITDSQYVATLQTLIDQHKVMPYTEAEYNNYMSYVEGDTPRPAYNATVDSYNPNQPLPPLFKNEAGLWVAEKISYQDYRLIVIYHLFQWGFLRNP